MLALVVVCSCTHTKTKVERPKPTVLQTVAPKVVKNPVVASIGETSIHEKEVLDHATKHAPELVILYDKIVVYVLHQLVIAKAKELKLEPEDDLNKLSVQVALALGAQDRAASVKMRISHLWVRETSDSEENRVLRKAMEDFRKSAQSGRDFTDVFIDYAEILGIVHITDSEEHWTGSFPEVKGLLVGQMTPVTDQNGGYSIIKLVSLDVDDKNRFDWLTRSETKRLFEWLSRDQNVRVVVERPE